MIWLLLPVMRALNAVRMMFTEKFQVKDLGRLVTAVLHWQTYCRSTQNWVRKYREAVGSLIYLSACTRPDLSHVVSKLSQYFSKPTEEQYITVKHVLKGTNDKMLCYRRCDEGWSLVAYSDADWEGDANDRHLVFVLACVRMVLWFPGRPKSSQL